MKRSTRTSRPTSRRARSVMFETLQPRELMAADASNLFMGNGQLLQKQSAQQLADGVLTSYEIMRPRTENGSPVNPKKFTSESDAQKFLTDAFMKTWQDVLGKSLDNKFDAYVDRTYSIEDMMFQTASVSSIGGIGSQSLDGLGAFSNATNNQVSLVDEADQFEVSSDGYVYALQTIRGIDLEQVFVFDSHDPKNLKKIATIDTKGFGTRMHLIGDQLILVSSDVVSARDGVSHIQVYGVSDPSNPILQTNLTVSGVGLQSRFADGKLTVFGNKMMAALRPLFISDDPTAVYTNLSETVIGHFETAAEYKARIQPLVIGWMLPDVKVEGSNVDQNSGDWKDLVAGSNSDYGQQVSVVSFELTGSGLEFLDSESLLGVSMMANYTDNNNVYITQALSTWRATGDILEILPPTTEIYAINSDSAGVEFVASGVIPGTIRDSRMMDEFNGNLRVFSDFRDILSFLGTASTDLYILQPKDGKLVTIGQLKDVADGQALYSAYFDEDQALITTWVAQTPNEELLVPTDPLHGFDLSDPTKPVELSELVIPGVSTYLQRIDSTHLIGLGYIDVGSGDWRQQVSLYDVSDLASLKVVDTWTSAQSMPAYMLDFRGLTQNALAIHFDPSSGLFSIASAAFGFFSNSSLTVFKIDTIDEHPLHFIKELSADSGIAQRSAVVGNTLYLISDVWLQTFAIDDLSQELDRELLTAPGVSDWLYLEEHTSSSVSVLENDFSKGGRVTSISASKVGATVTIVKGGSAIQYLAPDHVDTYLPDEVTYTVTLEDGTTYDEKLFVGITPHYNLGTQVESVTAQLAIVDDEGNVVGSVKQGEEYWIELSATDGRVNPQGVFASYVDVQFDSSVLTIIGDIEGIGKFQNGVHGYTTSEGSIKSLGAFTSSVVPSKEATARIARIRVRAEQDGATSLTGKPSAALSDETLLLGVSEAIRNVTVVSPQLSQLAKGIGLPGDISGDGEVSPKDLLMMVEQLNRQSQRAVSGLAPLALDASISIMDMSGDGELSPLDMIMLVNKLNENAAMNASGEAINDLAADEALAALMTTGFADQDDLLVKAKKSAVRV